MSNQFIIVEREGAVLRIVLNRPKVLNALNAAIHDELNKAFDDYAQDSSLRVAVITGAGDKAFCAGSDLKERAAAETPNKPVANYAGLINRFDLHKPVIAAVNGLAVGGGLEIVLACDIAVAVRSAQFGLPEPRVGLVATGGLHRLARALPLKHAMDIALSGRLFSADDALGYGLINAVVDANELDSEIERRTSEIIAGGPLAIAATKRMMQDGLNAASLAAAYATQYPELQRALASPDAIEGPRAFANKRAPKWQ